MKTLFQWVRREDVSAREAEGWIVSRVRYGNEWRVLMERVAS